MTEFLFWGKLGLWALTDYIKCILQEYKNKKKTVQLKSLISRKRKGK